MTKHNVLLINPSMDNKTQKRFITSLIRASFPLSLGYLAAYLMRENSIDVQVIDDQIQRLDDCRLEESITSLDEPRIIGITCLTATCGRVYEIARKVKNIDSKAKVIIGGIHATVLPEEALAIQGVDTVVRGEGEITFDQIVKHVINEKDYRYIKGISFRQNGNSVHNESSPLIKDLNSLPPFPYDLFEKNKVKYPGFFSVQTSRGCPYSCVFCSQRSITGQSYRYVSTDRALEDINTLVGKYNARVIRILDDNIAANKRRILELLEAIIASGLNEQVSFEAPLRGDNLNEEIAEKLKQANFGLVSFGLETGSERLMKLINKGETVEDVVRAINLASSKGLPTATTLIFGLPTETRGERLEAIRLVNGLPLDSVRYNILTPYPGTPVYEKLVKDGEVCVKDNWQNFSVQYMWQGDDLPYVPRGTDKYELMFTTMLANLWFYLRPSGIRRIFTRSFAGGNVVHLPRRWYISVYGLKVLRVGIFLISRFVVVCAKMFYGKLCFSFTKEKHHNLN